MEDNSTETFVLAMYSDLGELRYLYFVLVLLFYLTVIAANAALIAVIYTDARLHEPMYLFLCGLFANEIYGSTSLLPCFLFHILARSHHISATFCFLQIFNIHTYGCIEFGMLTAMAYDRYVCICRPLHYSAVVTTRKVQAAIVVIWSVCFLEIAVLLYFTAREKRCGRVINKVFCAHQLVVELSCSSDRTVAIIHDLVVGLVFTVAVPVTYISYTYSQILSVCFRGSVEIRKKALETCTPHFVSLVSFVFACFYSLISQRFDVSSVPYPLCILLSAYAMVVQPLQNPVMYGLKLSKIRQACKELLS